jgi:hypothetical protein
MNIQTTELLFFSWFMLQLFTKKQAMSRKQAAGGVKKAEFNTLIRERGKSKEARTETKAGGRRCFSLFCIEKKMGFKYQGESLSST